MSGFDIVPDGKPVEEPELAADKAYEGIPATGGKMLGEQAGSAIRSLGRVAEQGFYQGSGIFPQMLAGMGAEDARFGEGPAPGSLPTPMLEHDAYQERYAPTGNDGKPASLGEGPLPEAVAKLIGEAKKEEIERDNITARYENAHSWPTNFAMNQLGFMLDPLRAAAAFIPGIGEEALIARLGAGIVGRTAARLGAGAASGAAVMGPISALQYGLGREEASDYGLREALLDTAMGASFGAITHAGISGPIKDLWRWHKGAPIVPPPVPPGGFPPSPDEFQWRVPAQEIARQSFAPPQPGEFETAPQPPVLPEIRIVDRATSGPFALPEPPRAPPSPFRTTVEINGVRTVIEAADLPDFERQFAELRASAAAAPIVEADAETQHAAISTGVAQLADGRPVDTEAFFPPVPPAEPAPGAPPLRDYGAEYEANKARALPPEIEAEPPIIQDLYRVLAGASEKTPAEIATGEAQIHRDGFVSGVPPEELKQATTDIYSPPEPEKVEAPKPAPATETAAKPAGRPTPQVTEPPEGTKYVLPSFVTAPYRRPRGETSDWTVIGTNHIGQTLYEDQNGVRSYVEIGVRHTEPVGMRPTRGGMQIEIGDRADRPEYQVAKAPSHEPNRPVEYQAPAPVAAPLASEKPGYGDSNKIFTKDAAARAREVLRAKLSGTQLNAGFDPEIASAGLTLAGYHIEAGAHKFADFAREMVADLGEAIRPYLRGFYENARHYPEFEPARNMSSPEEIDRAIAEAANADHELPGSVRTGGIREGAEDGGGAPAGGPVGAAPEGEEPGGAHAPQPNLAGQPEPAPGGEAAGGGRGVRDTDRLPAGGETGPGSPGTAGRPAGERDGERAPDVDATKVDHAVSRVLRAYIDRGGRAANDEFERLKLNEAERQAVNVRFREEAHAQGITLDPGYTGGPPPPGRPNTDAFGLTRPDADVKGANHVIEPGTLAETRSARVKANDNLAAIELAKSLTAAGVPATKEQQAILARYVGWGGLSGAFPDAKGNFRAGLDKVGARLKELLTDDEHRAAAASVINAHYTSETIVRAMWDAVERLGFKGGSILEPGMGIGNFLGLMPGDIAAASRYQGIERDQITAQIAKLLYPESGVRQGDYSRLKVPLDHFDLAIGNPPFGAIPIRADARYAARGFSIHNFFFAKSIDSVRPGGLLAFITSHHTMNAMDGDARRFLAERAEFLGGVRLPNTAFKANAGTEVTTDILFFKKRPAQIDLGETPPDWTQSSLKELPDQHGEVATGPVNRYFAETPGMVLGEPGFFGKMHKGEYGVREIPGTVLADQLREALGTLPANVMEPPLSPEAKAAIDFSSTEKVDGSYYVAPDGRLMQYREGAGRPVAERGAGVEGGKTAAEIKLIRDFVPLRDAMRDVYRANLAGDTQAGDIARAQLGRVYDDFVAKNGPVNKTEYTYRRPSVVQQENARTAAREEARASGDLWDEGDFDASVMIAMGAKANEIARARETSRGLAKEAGREFNEGTFDPADMPNVVTRKQPNLDPLRDDQQSYVLSAAEDYNPETGLAEKRRIFFENNLTRYIEPELASANDGVLWSMNKHGRLDIDAIAEKLGVPRNSVVEELGDAVMRLPGTADSYVIRDAYLSGDVVTKLAEAKAAAETDPSLQRNVTALEAVQPLPLSPGDITMNLGMSWIPPDIMLKFIDDIGMGRPGLQFSKILGQWLVAKTEKYGPRQAEWSTGRLDAHELLEIALNGKNAIVRDVDRGPPRTTYVNQDETTAAQDIVTKLKEEFSEWTMADPQRAFDLATIYNGIFNRIVLRQWNGDYLTTPGVNSDWHWRPHQTRVVARIIQDGNTYMAHAVGAGKTSAMIGSAMEMRRLGLVSKPMFVVPNHMLGQFAKEFYEQYPTARIMVADSSNFHTSTRKQFVANIAQQDLDGVVITNSAFGMIPISEDYGAKMIQEATDEIDEAFAQLGQNPNELKKISKEVNPDNRFTVKRLQAQKQRLEQKLLAAQGRQDAVNTFEELGVDFLYVDEAHQFRKLQFATVTPMKGIDPDGSDMAWDLYTKTRYLNEQNPGRSLVLASGTPVTNTMGELYSLSRYIQPEALAERGLQHFDAWKQAFATTKTEMKQTLAGEHKDETRLGLFVNMPELYKMVGSAMDVVTSKDLAQYVTRPSYNRLAPNLAPQTPWLEDFARDILRRAEIIKNRKGPPAKGDDILFSLLDDGRKAAIDPRLFDKELPSDPASKLNMMIANVHRIWGETKDTQFYDPTSQFKDEAFRGPATQLVFANSGIATRNGKGETVFSAYQWMRREWIRMGIPASEIAFIRDYENPVAKVRLFNDVNEGKVRILVGSVQKMGTGVNVQRRLFAIHNLDPLWYPADDEQRNGRGFRQGNFNPVLDIHDYSTMGTVDKFMWELMASKGSFIEQFFRGDPNLRTMEDLGEADRYAQLAAMTTSDPRILELAQARQDLKKLERRQSAHRSEQFRYQVDVERAEREAGAEAESAAKMQDAIARSHQITGDNFKVTIGDQVLTSREDAVKAVDAAVAASFPALEVGKAQQIGEIGGFPLLIWAGSHRIDANEVTPEMIRAVMDAHPLMNAAMAHATARAEGGISKDDTPYFYLRLYEGKDISLGKVAAPNMIASAATYLRMLPDYLAGHQERQRAAGVRAQSSRNEIGKPFADEAQIPPLRQRVNELEAALGAPPTAAPEVPPEQIPEGAIQGAAGGGSGAGAPAPEEAPSAPPAPPDPAFTGNPDLVAAGQRLAAIEGQLEPEERALIDAAKARAGEAADEAGICIGESEA